MTDVDGTGCALNPFSAPIEKGGEPAELHVDGGKLAEIPQRSLAHDGVTDTNPPELLSRSSGAG